MQRIPVKDFCKFLILAALALTPLLNVCEVSALVTETLTSQRHVLTPVCIKLMKDVILLAVVCLGASRMLLQGRVLAEKTFWLFVFCTLLSFFLSVFNQNIYLTLAGIRYLLPFAVFFSIYGIIDDDFQRQVAKLLVFLLFVGLVLQVYQLLYGGKWYGLNFLGLSTRNPGFYLIPSSMAMFSLITMYYIYHYYPHGSLRRLLVYILGPISVLLTASGSGILGVGLFIFIIIYFKTKPKWIVSLACISLLLLLFLYLPEVTDRDDIYVSLAMRFGKLTSALSKDSLLLSNRFGYGTNTACLLMLRLDKGASNIFISDSTFISMILSFGMLTLVFMILFVARAMERRMIHIHFLAIFGTFMLTTIIFELFPVNLIFSVNLAYFLKNKHAISLYSFRAGANTGQNVVPTNNFETS